MPPWQAMAYLETHASALIYKIRLVRNHFLLPHFTLFVAVLVDGSTGVEVRRGGGGRAVTDSQAPIPRYAQQSFILTPPPPATSPPFSPSLTDHLVSVEERADTATHHEPRLRQGRHALRDQPRRLHHLRRRALGQAVRARKICAMCSAYLGFVRPLARWQSPSPSPSRSGSGSCMRSLQ